MQLCTLRASSMFHNQAFSVPHSGCGLRCVLFMSAPRKKDVTRINEQELAKAAADKLNARIDRVIFDIIDWDEGLRSQYDELVKKSTKRSVNIAISKAIKRIYGFESDGRMSAALIKSHTRFRR